MNSRRAARSNCCMNCASSRAASLQARLNLFKPFERAGFVLRTRLRAADTDRADDFIASHDQHAAGPGHVVVRIGCEPGGNRWIGFPPRGAPGRPRSLTPPPACLAITRVVG